MATAIRTGRHAIKKFVMYINTEEKERLRQRFRDYNAETKKKLNCTDDIGIMVYTSITDINNGKQVSISEIVKDIQTQSSRDDVDRKEQLPVAYFSVTGFNGNKTDKNVSSHSGLVVIDIDVKENPNTDFDKLYNDLQWNSQTYLCFRSPNNGIKLVIRTDIKDINHHKAYYNAIINHLLARYKGLEKIDTSGSNVSRGCFLSYDPYAFINPYSEVFTLSQDYIDVYLKSNPHSAKRRTSVKLLLQVEYLSPDEHFENIKNVIRNWTSVGKFFHSNGTSVGNDIKETSMGKGKETSVGIYDSVFNQYRFHNIKECVMSTDVPFFEFLVLKNSYPARIEHKTRLDEIYFKDKPNEPISTDSIIGLDGIEVCEVNINPNTVFNIGYRGKTLNSICLKLIYNNPFCHPRLILKELLRLNYFYSQDDNPNNPAPDEWEINSIVSSNYQKFVAGEIDFRSVMRTKKTKEEVSKRRVFWSRNSDTNIGSYEKQLISISAYTEGVRKKNLELYEKAIIVLMDGNKISVQRIADFMGKSRKQVSRYRKDERNKDLIDGYELIIKKYNNSLSNNS
jgi:hypothetical protein